MAITDGLITLDDARASIYGLPSNAAPTGSDEDLERYIEAATPVIERITGPMVKRERVFTFNGGSWRYTLPVRVQSVDTIEIDGAAVTSYTFDADASIVYFDGHTSYGIQNIVVTCTVGYADEAYPANVKLAARELVRFWWQQGRQGNRPGFGNDVPDTDSAPLGFLVPKRVMELLQATPNLGGFA